MATDVDAQRFWGPVDANIQWCEEDYAVSPYIAEFWNTLSSLYLVVLGIFGIIMVRRKASTELRFVFCWSSLMVVGIGSTLFHATMRYHAQVLDELPMVLGNLSILFALMDNSGVSEKRQGQSQILLQRWLPPCMVLWGVFSTIMYFAFPEAYLVFIFLYGLPVLLIIYYSLKLVIRKRSHRMGVILRRCFTLSLCLYGFGFILWNLEHILCPHVQNLQLHAWWHLFAGLGTHFLLLFTVVNRLHELKAEGIRKGLLILPYVEKLGATRHDPREK